MCACDVGWVGGKCMRGVAFEVVVGGFVEVYGDFGCFRVLWGVTTAFRCLFNTRFGVLGILLNDLIKPTRYGRKIAIYFIFLRSGKHHQEKTWQLQTGCPSDESITSNPIPYYMYFPNQISLKKYVINS